MLLLGISIVWPSKEITIQFTAFLTADPQSHALPFHYLLQLSYSVVYHVYLNLSCPQYNFPHSVIWSEGEQAQSGVSSCLDPPRTSEGLLTAPPSGEVTPTTPAPHEQALVSLETAISQQVHQPITELLLADSNPDSHGALAGAGLPQLSAPDRPNCEAEASQMEMSPAPTIGERGGGALDAVREGRLTLNHIKSNFMHCGSVE